MRPALLATLLISATLLAAPQGQRPPSVPPGDVGVSSDRLERISVVVRRYVDEHKLPGAVVVLARRGKVAYVEPFGVMDVTTKVPMRRDAIFRIASMSKQIGRAHV